MELGKFVIIISLFGICLLYCTSWIVKPPYVPLDTIASRNHSHENELIKTKGLVTDLLNLSDGNMLLNIIDNGTELPVFVSTSSCDKDGDLKLQLHYGDEIELEGRVQQYRGKYEIVTSRRGIKKINSDNSDDNVAYFVAEIAEYPANYEGRRIRVVGYICKVYRRIFYLCSDKAKASTGYKYQMRVVAEQLPEPELKKADKVIVEGVLAYNPVDMRYELKLISLSCL